MGLGPFVVARGLDLRRVVVVEGLGHDRGPEVPAVVYLAQYALVAHRDERAVDFARELRVALAHRYRVDYFAYRLADEFYLGVEARGVERYRLVEERRVEASVGEVLVGVGLDDVGAYLHVAYLFEHHLRVAFFKRSGDFALEVLKALYRVVLAAHRELQEGLVVGYREVDLALVLRRDLEAVYRDVVEVAVEARDEVVPRVVDVDGRAAHLFRERVDYVDLKAYELLRVLRVGEHVGESALGVSAPAKDFFAGRGRGCVGRRRRGLFREERGGRAERKYKRKNCNELFHQHVTPAFTKWRRKARVRSFFGLAKSMSPSSYSTISPLSMNMM